MLFGQLPINELEQISFKLPPDYKDNAAVLAKGKAKKQQVYLGCAKWGRPEWVGKIYPPGTKEKDFLSYYGKHYDSIELNALNYKMYDGETIESWVKKVNNPAFKFCPKAHRGMSFLKNSAGKASLTESFIESIRYFGKNLGPVFITHDEKLKWDEQAEKDFFEYLETLPRDITFFIEERNPVFFADKQLMTRYYDRLKQLRIGTVITDTAGRPDVCHMRLTIPKAFIRFVGNSLHPSDYPRIDQWAARIKKWLDADIEEVYFFMHMHDEGLSPELTQYTVKQFNKKCGLNLPEVEFVK